MNYINLDCEISTTMSPETIEIGSQIIYRDKIMINGRQTLCTPELIEKIYQNLKTGVCRETAARLSGISKTTLYNYLQRAEAGEVPYVDFLATLERAEDEIEQELITSWKSLSEDKLYTINGDEMLRKGDWKGAAEFLKRRRPKEYSDQTFINIEKELGKDATAIEKIEALSCAIVEQMSCGKISADSASVLLKAIDDRRKLIETCDHEKRIKENEEKLKAIGA